MSDNDDSQPPFSLNENANNGQAINTAVANSEATTPTAAATTNNNNLASVPMPSDRNK